MSANPQRELAVALRRAQRAAPGHILRSRQLTRRDRTLLQKRGFLIEIIKGWYALTTPQAQPGDTTFWHLHFWAFASSYLQKRYADRYCLSAVHSLDLWVGNTQTPKQLVVTTTRSGCSHSICPTVAPSSCIRGARLCLRVEKSRAASK